MITRIKSIIISHNFYYRHDCYCGSKKMKIYIKGTTQDVFKTCQNEDKFDDMAITSTNKNYLQEENKVKYDSFDRND